VRRHGARQESLTFARALFEKNNPEIDPLDLLETDHKVADPSKKQRSGRTTKMER
jgi:hypothetical protein